MLLPALLIAAQAANVPELPKDVPATAARYTVMIMGQTAGQQAVWTDMRPDVLFQRQYDKGPDRTERPEQNDNTKIGCWG